MNRYVSHPAFRKLIFMLAVALALLVLPYGLSGYLLQFTIILLVFLVLAESFDLLCGFTGYVNLGHVVPFGVSAYVFAILFRGGYPVLSAMLLGVLVSLIYALAICYPIFKLKGDYFTIGTLALEQFVWLLTYNLREITGGADGLAIPAGDVSLPAYYMAATTLLIVTLLHYFIGRTKFGLGLKAILGDEVAAQHSGINISLHKYKIFTLSSLFAGLVGPIYVWNINYIEPSMCFGYAICFFPTVASLLGGRGYFYGPIIGGIVVLGIQEVLWSYGIRYSLLLYGIILMFVGLFMTRGFAGSPRLRKMFGRLKSPSLRDEGGIKALKEAQLSLQ
jgi:branched-chain amino acid transport system permease protein